MKLRANRAPSYHAGPNMTPLVDVVMVILIFLMLAGSFGASQHFLAADMADTGGAPPAAPPAAAADKEMFDVLMWRGRDGTFVAQAGDVRAGDPATLAAALARKRKLYAANGMPGDEIRVVIRPTADVPFKHVAAAFEAVLNAGYENVVFATSK